MQIQNLKKKIGNKKFGRIVYNFVSKLYLFVILVIKNYHVFEIQIIQRTVIERDFKLLRLDRGSTVMTL